MKNLVALLILLFPSISLADDCNECIERKKQMCASECDLVDSKSALKCQKDCIIQYCSHKCSAEHEAIKNLLEYSCEKCQDDQFNLCECSIGSDRTQAICKISCAKKKCEPICN